MTYRVIALDLDGTLLTPQKTILPESLAALQKAKQAGYQVLIVTGRHHVAIHPFYQALRLDTPAICCNGTYLYDYHAKKVLSSDPLSHQQAHAVVKLLAKHQVHGLMYVDDAMLYQHDVGHVERTRKWASTLPEEQRPVFLHVASLDQEVDQCESIWKFALTDDNIPRLQQFTAVVEQELGLTCEWSWHDQVDVAQTGNSKGKRLAQWVESQGLSMANVVAFGDNFNDISMLASAGMGVAMGNAADEVKQHARQIITDNTKPGIADFITRSLL